MPAGRPRKSSAVLEISGAFRKNPGRRRAREAEPKVSAGLGDPPEEWVADAAHNPRCAALLKIWNKIVGQDQACLKVLNASHRMLVENTCKLQYKIDRAVMGYGKATSGDYAQVSANLARMGMTPVDSPHVAEAVRAPARESSPKRGGSGWGELVG